jgi:lysophospholipid acyltransferase (LPLAT)-like uncharacterized protein
VDRTFRNAFNRVRNTVGTVVVAASVRLLLFTVRYRARNWQAVKALAQHGEGVIYAFWHDVMMLPLGHESRKRTVALVSAGLDGTFAARIVRHFGVRSICGKWESNGAGAVIEVLRSLPERHSLVVTPDGPRGPRYRAHGGAVFLASRSGLPLVPVGLAFSRCWRLRSWDGFRIAKPFSRAEMLFGEPRRFPRDLDRGDIERERAWLENQLHALSKEAHARVGETWPE